jgi:hypothetical protein
MQAEIDQNRFKTAFFRDFSRIEPLEAPFLGRLGG